MTVRTSLETKNHRFEIRIQKVYFGPPLPTSSELSKELTITLYS
jgi:hypothetical protein